MPILSWRFRRRTSEGQPVSGAIGLHRFAQHIVSRVVESAVDLLFPPRCISCTGWTETESTPLCKHCAAIIDGERQRPACPRCASPVAPFEVSKGRCGKCRNLRPRVAGTVRVGPYRVWVNGEGPGGSVRSYLGRLLRYYKYHSREELGPVLGGWLADVVADAPWLDRIEAIVSVPTHWKHRLSRPLYAADPLASVVAKKTGLPHLPILRRVRAGPHQIGLKYPERLANVRGAFALRRGVALQDARLLLVDDVKTTGATINECAKVLRQGGAAEVYAAVVVTVGWDHPTGNALSSI